MTTSPESRAEHGEASVECHEPKGDYQVGYRRPPVQHRFKPGNNANPKGRKKKTRNRKVVIRELLFEPVTVREGGVVKEIPALEAVIKKTLSQALGGDHKAALTIIGMAQREGVLTPEQEEDVGTLPETDMAIMQDAMMRFGATTASVIGAGASPAEARQTDAK
jgi:Family of unknown function (DUF5681)